ncbi:hypothetical protein PY365_03060 [Roseiarcaceae bacterium H3SJ34-1]|uniref:hypothetical protein n=1 Tax=Terripilifer ovatus TaxID=3032367 RepID=UPI003AB98A73|nr:hypothetical protein [Roseiarcaceae bacterium H3SJ34-1]
MQRYIIKQNIERFSDRLQNESDPHKRETIKRLLADEVAKLSELENSEAHKFDSKKPSSPEQRECSDR